MPWKLALSDVIAVNSATDLIEIDRAKQRRLTFPLNGPDTVSFPIDLKHRLADRILECKDFLFAYDDRGVQVMNGPVISAEEVAGDAKTIAITAQSGWWWLGKRLVGKSHAGYTFTNTDRSVIIRHLVENLAPGRGDQNGPVITPTYMAIGAVTNSGVLNNAGPWHYKPIDEAIREIAATLDGPDWWLEYFGPGSVDPEGNAITANMSIAPVRGIDRSASVIFEYGCGRRTMASYSRPVTRDGLLSDAYGLPPGFPQTSDAVQRAIDATLEGTYGMAEGVVPSDVGDANLRQQLLAEHVRVRKQPRQVITWQPATQRAATPVFKRDYDVGDIVTGRAVVDSKVRFNATFRIYQVTIDIDDVGVVTPTLQVIPG